MTEKSVITVYDFHLTHLYIQYENGCTMLVHFLVVLQFSLLFSKKSELLDTEASLLTFSLQH